MLKTPIFSMLTVVMLSACGSSTTDTPPPISTAPPPPPAASNTVNVAENKLGAWLFYIDEPGLVRTNHADMATYLASMGVKRVFIKISVMFAIPSMFQTFAKTTCSFLMILFMAYSTPAD